MSLSRGRKAAYGAVLLVVATALVAGVIRFASIRAYRFEGYPYEPVGEEPFENALAELVPGLLAEYETPGAAVALIRDHRVVWQRGFGLADRDSGRPVKVSTGFNVGSISKSVTAVGVMALVEEGKLGLDEPVDRYLTRWHLPPSRYDPDGVTIFRILGHSAGLSMSAVPEYPPNAPIPSLIETLEGGDDGGGVRVIYEPGSEARYSGGGYTVLQLAIEDVTGERFNDYMTKRVFEPLEMQSSSFEWSHDVEERLATPYASGAPIPGPRFSATGAAGLMTTLEDMTRFAGFVLEQPAAQPVVTSETMHRMLSAARPAESYGLGFQLRVVNGVEVVGHVGNNNGWMANLELIPETGDGLIVLTNATEGIRVHNALVCEWLAWRTGSGPEEFCRRREKALRRLKRQLF